jgi:hypothetical protein
MERGRERKQTNTEKKRQGGVGLKEDKGLLD